MFVYDVPPMADGAPGKRVRAHHSASNIDFNIDLMMSSRTRLDDDVVDVTSFSALDVVEIE